MKKEAFTLRDAGISLGILAAAFAAALLLQELIPSQRLVSMILVLAVFITALLTRGYFWGILSSLAAVLLHNFVFTFPYLAFDFLSVQNFIAALVMLAVAVITGMLTTKLKEQERLKAEAEKEKMRGNLLRAISHDLRTPLTTIYGASSAIMENYDSLSRERQLQLLGQVREDSESLIRMVENLLSVTRISGETIRVKKSPTVLEELIDNTLQKFAKHYPRQAVEVSIPDTFISIPMDAMLIQQVLINLLENAIIHAGNMTQLRLTVTEEDGFAVFEVADNGCGIPRSKLSHLFTGQIYGTEEPTDSRRTGMGIGLSVCATIIKAHGGEITARNQEAGGAAFRFRLEMEKENYEQQ